MFQTLRALETTVWEKFDTGESPDAWKALQKTLKDYEANKITAESCIYRFEEVVSGAVEQESLVNQILSLHESQRKQTETLVRSRKVAQQIMSEQQWNQLLNILIRVLRNNIYSRKQLDAIQKGIRAEVLVLESEISF